jgi:hypothetical protein
MCRSGQHAPRQRVTFAAATWTHTPGARLAHLMMGRAVADEAAPRRTNALAGLLGQTYVPVR